MSFWASEFEFGLIAPADKLQLEGFLLIQNLKAELKQVESKITGGEGPGIVQIPLP
jgi:hypothetical protein